ncbi:MAG: elongation factor G [Gammaproteobacteria bacterium]|nr:elongation factor G [Gammaproteobacteria bacterium]
MPQYRTEDIRNIALVGYGGAGKTTLVEALLHQAGTIPAPGNVEKGTTVCDYDPLEQRLGHSLEPAVVSLDTDGRHINILDTPGSPDLIGRAVSVLPAVETVLVVVDADAGIEITTQRMMEMAAKRNLCRMVVINKIDHADNDIPGLLARLQETFGAECLPINLPADGGARVLDCFFQPGGEATDFSSVAAAHTAIIDQVVEVDEALMEVYLEQGQELRPEQLHDPFEQALRDGHLIPVCFTAAATGAGVAELLNIMVRLMPNPTEGNAPPFLKGEGKQARPVTVVPDPQRHVVAHVFRVSHDNFMGKTGLFRVHQGTVTPNSQLFVGDARKPFKVGHLLKVQGRDSREVSIGVPGDICAVAKVDDLHFDAVLHDSHDEDHFHLKSIDCPAPMYGLAIEVNQHGEEKRLSDALHKLADEDPCLRVEHNAQANETVIRGQGELHLKVVLEKMAERFNIHADTHPPSIPYRETIGALADGHARHKKQTGGAGQFGEVYLRVEPLEQGQGLLFEDAVVGGAIPSVFIPAVEKGVRQVAEEGAVAGFPMQDLRVTVYDGKHHPVDSKEVAFVAAGRKAFLDAVAKARPVVMEPIVNIRIDAPAASTGDITGDLAGMRGRINGTTALANGRVRVMGQVPLSELEAYQSRLKSVTGGEGTFLMDFSHYEAVPPKVQQELVAAHRPRVQEE